MVRTVSSNNLAQARPVKGPGSPASSMRKEAQHAGSGAAAALSVALGWEHAAVVP